MIQKIDNIIIDGSAGKPILIDVTFKSNKKPKQVVIFCHGFKGFKDWGPFNQIATYFANKNIVFVKFNFSFNGTTITNPTDFKDLEAFGNNNFSKELDDLSLVIKWVKNYEKINKEIDINRISLFGHSRGGGIAILKTIEDMTISNIISWASPSNFLDRLPKGDKLDKWEKLNVAYAYNGRTKQNMPMYFQFYEDCKSNTNRFNIEHAVRKLKIPCLVIHGEDDPTVPISDAENIKSWNDAVKLHVIAEANHVLGGFHPFDTQTFPKNLQEAVDVTISFLKE